MLKIMAADDEILFLERICKTIDWNSLGFEVCCTATDGRQALEKAEIYKPDIALIDINMPYINGLELVELLLKKLPMVVVVIISGYSEFEYTRQAMKLGVREYILKPYDDEELIGILVGIKADLYQRSIEAVLNQNTQRLWIENKLNVMLMDNKMPNPIDLQMDLEQLGIGTDYRYYGIIGIEIDFGNHKQMEISEIELWKFIVLNVTNDFVKVENGSRLVMNGPEDRIIIIAGFNNEGAIIEVNILDQLKELCQLIESKFHFTLTIGVGTFVEDIQKIVISYRKSLAAIRNNLIFGKNKVIEYNKLATQTSNVGFYSSEINDDLHLFLRQVDITRIVEKVEQVFIYIHERKFSTDNTYMICTGLVSICLSFIVQTGHHIEEIFGEDFSPLNKIKQLESLEEIKQWILEVFKLTLEGCNRFKMTKSRILADEVKQYIESNYHDPNLRVNEIARVLFVSENYLMSVFKKEFGITIVDHIVATRIMKARELIGTSNLKLTAISLMVGYQDAGYFSKCFKKYYGMSPSDYENEVKYK